MKLELPEYRYCPQCGAQVELQNKEGRNRPVCSACGHIIYVNPIPAAALVVLEKNRALLTLRDVEPKKGEWCLPGGFLEWGESPEEGAKRELLEETGITAEELSLGGVYDSVTGARLHVLLVVYRVTSWSDTFVQRGRCFNRQTRRCSCGRECVRKEQDADYHSMPQDFSCEWSRRFRRGTRF